MYDPVSVKNPEIQKYLDNINNVINAIDSLMDFRKWDDSLAYLGRLSEVPITQLQLEYSSNKAFKPEMLDSKLNELKGVIVGKVDYDISSSDDSVSPIIYGHFSGKSSVEAHFGELATN